jgi:CRP-like cAMP-binding protein
LYDALYFLRGIVYPESMIDSSLLYKHALFGGLEKEQIDKILPVMKRQSFQTGDVILAEGVCNDSIYFLLEGGVDVRKAGVFLARLNEGDAFGEVEILDIHPVAATITALCPVVALTLSNKALHGIYKDDSAVFTMLIMNLARELARRLRDMDIKVINHDE